MATSFFDPYKTQPGWKGKRVTPTQLLVHDIYPVPQKYSTGASESRLEIEEVPTSSLLHESSLKVPPELDLPPKVFASCTGVERQQLQSLREAYGWLNALRIPLDQDEPRVCRWMSV